ncbi:CPG4 domain-containing protein [Aphelenchoides fujianensis]|nr:CPG4 domain-containing protein [Aphelenchoides fujianensis]
MRSGWLLIGEQSAMSASFRPNVLSVCFVCFASNLLADAFVFPFARLPHSPLDDPREDTTTNSRQSPLDSLDSLIPTAVELARLPSCQQACNEHFSEALHIAMNAGNHFERYKGVCHYYNETVQCQDGLINCQGRQTFDMMTSGLRFMCVEQRAAFNKVIECMDTQANDVQDECEKKCQGRVKAIDWASKMGFLDLAGPKKEFPQINSDQMREIVQEVCDVAQCYLTCVRTEYDQKCGNSAGTLLSETIVRPFAETQNEPLIAAMGTFMNLFSPQQCAFVINKDQLAVHRIDPELDKTLRQADEPPAANQTADGAPADGGGEQPTQRDFVGDVPTSRDFNGTILVYDDVDETELGREWGLDIGMAPPNEY